MRTKRVVVLPYNPEWKVDFEKIKKEIENAKALETKIIEDRHRFHTCAEVGGNEYRTIEHIRRLFPVFLLSWV